MINAVQSPVAQSPASGDIGDEALARAGLHYVPRFLSESSAEQAMKSLQAGLDWRQESVTLFGRRHPQPRLIAWYGDQNIRYSYSGILLSANGWQQDLLAIKDRLSALTEENFNSVLCNLYRDGQDAMGWHADDERALGDEPLIASVSLGAERRFLLRRKDNHREKLVLQLRSGSCLLMTGVTQRDWQHALPRTRRPIGARINLSFRRIVR